LAELFEADFTESENRVFKSSWGKAVQTLDAGTPPVLGPMDMFHLHYYPELYHKRHIPIHFVLLVGYENNGAYIYDTDKQDVQTISLDELRLAWDVNVPGLGKRNRFAVLNIAHDLPPTDVLIRKSITDQCRTMLHPPVSMVGIPAMKKIASEIVGWPDELGKETAAKCLRQVREYLNSPPDLEGNHLTAGRDLYIAFLQEAGEMTGVDFSVPIHYLRESIIVVPDLADAIRCNQLERASSCFERVAEAETSSYAGLLEVVSVKNFVTDERRA
jgi:hypothetical protein